MDLISLIRGWNLECQSDTMTLDAVLSAQNPGLNPQLLEKAIAAHLPALTPDFTRIRRRELLDADGRAFR